MSASGAQDVDRIPSRRVGVVAAVAVLFIVLSAGVVFALLGHRPMIGTTPTPVPRGSIGIVDQGPILDVHRASDLRRAQRLRLTQYRWLDDRHDLAEIPVDRAMAIIAEKKR